MKVKGVNERSGTDRQHAFFAFFESLFGSSLFGSSLFETSLFETSLLQAACSRARPHELGPMKRAPSGEMTPSRRHPFRDTLRSNI